MSARVLPREEWGRVPGPHLPVMLADLDPSETTILAEEKDGEIVATLGVMRAAHLEGLWIHPEHRSPGVARRLLRQAVEVAREATPHDWCFVAVGEGMEAMVERLGGRRVPVALWVLPLGKGK